MKYMMFVCTDPAAEPYTPEHDNIGEWVSGNDAKGIRLHGDRLRPPEDAVTVRVRKDEVLISDGPFAETKEWIAGYDMLECASMEEAVQVASKHPMARFGRIEVRAVWPFE